MLVCEVCHPVGIDKGKVGAIKGNTDACVPLDVSKDVLNSTPVHFGGMRREL